MSSDNHTSKQQHLSHIIQKMRTTSTLEELVKITTEELGKYFKANHIILELGIETKKQDININK